MKCIWSSPSASWTTELTWRKTIFVTKNRTGHFRCVAHILWLYMLVFYYFNAQCILFFFPPKEKSSSPTCVIQMWMAQSFINLNYKMFDQLWYSSIYSSLTPFVVNYRSVYSLGNFYQLFNFYHFCHGRPSKVKFT